MAKAAPVRCGASQRETAVGVGRWPTMSDPPACRAPPHPRIGTAGWSLPAQVRPDFPESGHLLQRYSARLDAVEVNSTFYRPHRPTTFDRWRELTPPAFRFALKLPKAATHDAGLIDCEPVLDRFFGEIGALAEKAGPILVQLPPSQQFDETLAERFFEAVRRRWTGAIACEPRHASWFTESAEILLLRRQVARVAADPPRHPQDGRPGGWPELAYWRLHGSPRVYWSDYEAPALEAMAERLSASTARETWCIFDNTAAGQAAGNALDLAGRLSRRCWSPGP
jgi:uncharacterized protein YecE (DUF72 family)